MPDFWAHRICANLSLSQLSSAPAADVIQRSHSSFSLGSQGADLLYFRPVQLFLGRRGVVHMAKRLHEQPVDRLAGLGADALLSLPKTRQTASLFAYVAGFLSHHSVDQQVHPKVEQHAMNFMRHRRIELDLDAYLSSRLNRRPPEGSRPWTGMAMPDLPGLSLWYNCLLDQLDDRALKPSACRRAYKVMKRASRLINRPARLLKPRHTEKAVLSERELKELMDLARLGALQGSRLIEQLYDKLAAQGYCFIENQPAAVREATLPV